MATEISIEEWDNVYPVMDDTLLLAHNIEVDSGDKVLEIGCGTGYVSITAALMGGVVSGVDINPAAVELSTANARRNGISDIEFRLSDMFENVEGTYDTIIFNPPYLPSEEFSTGIYDRCWDGGREGCEVTERFIDGVMEHLSEKGKVYLVLSSLSNPSETMKRLDLMGLETEIIGRKKLFFEELFVVRSRPRGP
ncbi:MAG TPA: methyltransferase [Candidatus Methanofastidiosa archaeon]|nr:methyltransferase [Candidatus Methanofastidiosa archaeon]